MKTVEGSDDFASRIRVSAARNQPQRSGRAHDRVHDGEREGHRVIHHEPVEPHGGHARVVHGGDGGRRDDRLRRDLGGGRADARAAARRRDLHRRAGDAEVGRGPFAVQLDIGGVLHRDALSRSGLSEGGLLETFGGPRKVSPFFIPDAA